MKKFFKFEFVYDNELSNKKLVEDVLEAFATLGLLVASEQNAPNEPTDQPYILTHHGMQVAHSFHNLVRNYFEGYWVVLRAFRYLQKKHYNEKDFLKKILTLGHKLVEIGAY